ncbi:MAG: NUDIX domain-containing protein [Bacilli bacterium]|nr:NUDIX domain-containing protein [Bacilli bacterium]
MKEKSCGMIVINDGKVLIVKQNSGFYGFPKGHMEEGETEIETAIRETREETNIESYVTSEKRYSISYPIKNGIPKEVVYFVGKTDGVINPKNQEAEVAEILFVDIDKVRDTLTFDNLKELWDEVLKDLND